MDLLEGDEGHGQMAFTGFYELKLSRYLRRLGKSGGLMVDVGANYGYFSLIWAAQKSTNRVIAYEASPRNQPALRTNIAKNHFSDRITLKPLAAGKQSGKLGFHLGPEEQTGWGGFALDGPREKMVEVPVVRLDEDLADAPSIDVLKIDTEGADTWVLEGVEGFLREKKIRHIFFEEHKGRMEKLGIPPGNATAYLLAMGYSVFRMDGGVESLVCEYHAFI
jgi:FkbM family methyltransferase